jgi:hypothetical protein
MSENTELRACLRAMANQLRQPVDLHHVKHEGVLQETRH